jgi:hypothetical protein
MKGPFNGFLKNPNILAVLLTAFLPFYKTPTIECTVRNSQSTHETS